MTKAAAKKVDGAYAYVKAS